MSLAFHESSRITKSTRKSGYESEMRLRQLNADCAASHLIMLMQVNSSCMHKAGNFSNLGVGSC